MELHYFPTASYVLAQCVHYCPEAFTSTITLDPFKTVRNARLNLSTALNLNSNKQPHCYYICITITDTHYYRHSFVHLQLKVSCGFIANIRCRNLIWVQKCLMGSSGFLCPVSSSHNNLLKWQDILQIYAFPYCLIPCNQNHVHPPAEIGRTFWSQLKKKP